MPKDPGPQVWQADFLERTPMLMPLRFAGAHLRGAGWPTLEALQPSSPLKTLSGQTLRFVPQGAKPACFAEQYEPRIHLRGEVTHHIYLFIAENILNRRILYIHFIDF